MTRPNVITALPTLLTLGNLLSGFAAIVCVFEGRWPVAAALIFLSAVLDALDGHVARALGVETREGAVLDSLADLVAFGVAPATLILELCRPATLLPWGAAAWLLCAVALRLARFTAGAPSAARAQETQGLPCPAAAMTIAATAIALYWANWRGGFTGEHNLADWVRLILPAAAAGMGVLMLTKAEYPRPQEWLLDGLGGVRIGAVVALVVLALLIAGGYAPLLACGLFITMPLLRAPLRVFARHRRSVEL